MTISSAKELSSHLISKLETIRTTHHFDEIWGEAEAAADKFDLEQCRLPRTKKVPRRLE